ncbi:MAG: hypothetical protein CK426_04270 [Legionella sp.]|nr:MAG: hypothetical protein CK423_03520 [Legionella sp.]PJD98902.1 MAG: hypothetical protein CK426_04270 [Legionella sp.]
MNSRDRLINEIDKLYSGLLVRDEAISLQKAALLKYKNFFIFAGFSVLLPTFIWVVISPQRLKIMSKYFIKITQFTFLTYIKKVLL